jgi:hypothetical protein
MKTENWTKDSCIESAIKYRTVDSWKTSDFAAYTAARENKWLKECVSRIHSLSNFSRTKEQCMEDARNFSSVDEYMDENPDSYFYGERHGWIKDITHAIKEAPETREP